MKVAALFSGGKDSVFAVSIAQQYGWEITHFVTLESTNTASWMFHSVNIHLAEYLSQAIGIPLVTQPTLGKKEHELKDLQHCLESLSVDGVISGAIASEYQRTRIEQVCYNLELKSFTPLWHKNQELLLHQQRDAGFTTMIVGVFAQGFDKAWLGRILDESCIQDLVTLQKKYRVNPAGEGGEYETLVLDGPIFQKKLVLDDVSVDWRRDSGVLQVNKAHLE
ncbi:MAG: diphthine--ammonia ligase [Methanobacteriota archaeon]